MKAIATNVGNNTNSYANSEPTIVISDLMMPTPNRVAIVRASLVSRWLGMAMTLSSACVGVEVSTMLEVRARYIVIITLSTGPKPIYMLVVVLRSILRSIGMSSIPTCVR